MSKELIRLRNIRMAFDDEVVLNDLNLYINDKEFLTLLGPSGCGKTTTLRIIGGSGIPEGKKSVAFNLTLRSDDRSLTAQEADEDVKSILETLKAELNAVLR